MQTNHVNTDIYWFLTKRPPPFFNIKFLSLEEVEYLFTLVWQWWRKSEDMTNAPSCELSPIQIHFPVYNLHSPGGT